MYAAGFKREMRHANYARFFVNFEKRSPWRLKWDADSLPTHSSMLTVSHHEWPLRSLHRREPQLKQESLSKLLSIGLPYVFHMSLWQDNCHSSPTNSYTMLVCSGATRMNGEVSAVQWKLCEETKVSSLPTSDLRLVYSSLGGEKCIFAFWYVWHSCPKGAPLQRERGIFMYDKVAAVGEEH